MKTCEKCDSQNILGPITTVDAGKTVVTHRCRSCGYQKIEGTPIVVESTPVVETSEDPVVEGE